MEEHVWKFLAETPSLFVAVVLVFIFLKALDKRDETIKEIAAEHTTSYKANTEVLKENSQILGECASVLKDCRDEMRIRKRVP